MSDSIWQLGNEYNENSGVSVCRVSNLSLLFGFSLAQSSGTYVAVPAKTSIRLARVSSCSDTATATTDSRITPNRAA